MKLDNKRTILIGFAFLAISAFWQVYDNIIPLILKYTFHIGDTLSGGIMALDNILALFLLPFFGAWSDKINTKRGKRTPFIFVGTILAVIFMLLLPAAANARNLILFVAALFCTLLSNYEPLFISIAVIMLLSLAILLWKVDENRFVAERIEIEEAWGIEEEETEVDEKGNAVLPKPVKRSLTFLLLSVAFWYMAYNGVTTAFSKYATEMWGMAGGGFASALMVASIGALISFVPVGIISSRLGRKKVILFGVLLLAASFFAAFLFQTPNFGINIVFLLVGIAWASINVNSYPMVVEMCKGSDIGKFTGMYYTFSMAAQVLTPVLSGAFLEHIGYWTLFPYATVFSLIAFLTMLMVRHGDSKPQPPKGRLEAFDVDD